VFLKLGLGSEIPAQVRRLDGSGGAYSIAFPKRASRYGQRTIMREGSLLDLRIRKLNYCAGSVEVGAAGIGWPLRRRNLGKRRLQHRNPVGGQVSFCCESAGDFYRALV
jgi:hypothetical protein